MIALAPPCDVVAAAAVATKTTAASPEPPRNAVFVELLGNGLVYSIDYERMIPSWHLGLRAGASYFAYPVSNAQGSGDLKLASFPLVASYYLGSAHHKLQLGLGATILWVDASSDSTGAKFDSDVSGVGVAATGVVGYRYVPSSTGFTFGAGFTPLLRETKGFLAWGGASAGLAF